MSQLRRELKEFIAELRGPKHEPKEYILQRLEKLLVKEKPINNVPPKLEVVYLVGGRRSGKSSKLQALALELAGKQGLAVIYVTPDAPSLAIHKSLVESAKKLGMEMEISPSSVLLNNGSVTFLSAYKSSNPQLWPTAQAVLLDDVPLPPILEHLTAVRKIVCSLYLPGHGRPGITVEELSPLADSHVLANNGFHCVLGS